MRFFFAAGLAAAFALWAGAPALADQDSFSIGAQAGSLGVGAEATAPIAPLLDMRGNFGQLGFSMNGNASGVNYTANAHINSVGGMLDVHPFNNGFRLTGGIVTGGNSVGFVGTPNSSQTFTINGNQYSAAAIGQVVGNATFGGANPYVGLGFGGGRGRHGSIGMTFDVGVVMEQAPVVTVGTTKDDLPPQAQAQLAADLATAKTQFQNNVNFLKTYPVVRIGLEARV